MGHAGPGRAGGLGPHPGGVLHRPHGRDGRGGAMRGFVAVFEREIVERRLLPLAALALGIVALAAPLLPGMPAAAPSEVRSGVALGLALIVRLVVAMALGGSVIARDLGERRL